MAYKRKVVFLTVVITSDGANRVLHFLQSHEDVRVDSILPLGMTGNILVVFSVAVESNDAAFAALGFFEEQFEASSLKQYVVHF